MRSISVLLEIWPGGVRHGRLKGKKVIMNGGAHGLGLASLWRFAAEGADVAFFSRKQDKIDAARDAIAKAGNGKVFAEVPDMAGNHEGYKAWLAKAADELGGWRHLCPYGEFVRHRRNRRLRRP